MFLGLKAASPSLSKDPSMPIKKTSRRAPKRRGFSLVELLLVLSLAPIVFFAVYSNFSSGVKLWQRLQVKTPEEDQVIFRLKTQRDFQNALRYVPVPFQGEDTNVAFMACIAATELGGDRAIGQVRYFYDDSHNTIVREVRDFSQLYREAQGQVTVMQANVGSFSLQYLAKSDAFCRTPKPSDKEKRTRSVSAQRAITSMLPACRSGRPLCLRFILRTLRPESDRSA